MTDKKETTVDSVVESSEIIKGKKVLQVKLGKFKGTQFVDIRQLFETSGGDMHPTKKGIAFPPAMLTEVITSLEKIETAITK